jgi:hypothetical protein
MQRADQSLGITARRGGSQIAAAKRANLCIGWNDFPAAGTKVSHFIYYSANESFCL